MLTTVPYLLLYAARRWWDRRDVARYFERAEYAAFDPGFALYLFMGLALTEVGILCALGWKDGVLRGMVVAAGIGGFLGIVVSKSFWTALFGHVEGLLRRRVDLGSRAAVVILVFLPVCARAFARCGGLNFPPGSLAVPTYVEFLIALAVVVALALVLWRAPTRRVLQERIRRWSHAGPAAAASAVSPVSPAEEFVGVAIGNS
jgi:hypothetical protein